MAAHGITTEYIEGLRPSERERTILLEQLRKSGVCDRRKHVRLGAEGRFSLNVLLEYPGGSSARFRIYPWDLSAGGLGFFHRSYVHPGTKCSFTGSMCDGQPVALNGEVARCDHVAGSVHHVGVKFDMEIDPEIFLGDPGTGTATRSSDWWVAASSIVADLAKLIETRTSPDEVVRKSIELLQHVRPIQSESTKPAV